MTFKPIDSFKLLKLFSTYLLFFFFSFFFVDSFILVASDFLSGHFLLLLFVLFLVRALRVWLRCLRISRLLLDIGLFHSCLCHKEQIHNSSSVVSFKKCHGLCDTVLRAKYATVTNINLFLFSISLCFFLFFYLLYFFFPNCFLLQNTLISMRQNQFLNQTTVMSTLYSMTHLCRLKQIYGKEVRYT